MNECNAVIKSATITNADHGVLSAYIHLDYGGAGQAFGGYVLYSPSAKSGSHEANYAGLFIWRVLETVGVSEWERLPGKTVRVRQEHDKVHAIGHIVKDEWFYAGQEFTALENAKTHVE